MYKKKVTWWVSAAWVLLLLTLTGCQSVQGVDLAAAIQQSSAATSSESAGSLQIELVPGDTSQLSAVEQQALSALHKVTIELANVKTESTQKLSADGTITYGKGTIPFQIAVDGTKLIWQVEGGKKPVVIDLLGSSNASFTKLLPAALQEQIGSKAAEIKPAVIGFILANMPNPPSIAVSSVTEKVGGADLSLQKVHMELTGTELASLLDRLLSGILADEAGLQELISQLYDAMYPIIQEEIASGSADFTLKLLGNKPLAVGFIYQPVHDYLAKAAESLAAVISGDGEQGVLPVHAMFGSKSALAADFYVDGDHGVRKQSLALSMPMPDTGTGVAGLKLNFVSETWNVNKPVKADSIDISGGFVPVGVDASTVYRVLGNLDRHSLIYTLLREDAKIARKEVHLQLNESGDPAASDTPQPFINGDSKTMVPVRFISEKLGAEVGWNADTKEVTILDLLSGRIIVLKLDRRTASVDGASIELESAATLVNGSTFVPIRFIAESLGGVVSFDDDTRVVTIKRD
ncbi:copper amine oxidase N-terminal domain-containing protein [Bacillus sp. 3255]|uniref:copper amine oxidase N-terminal domain-containing protein n=1 Tax=Bacillus sp. 3255 TaxID=2817904 RepID=UPI0028577800|nr:copper amine oxidase N-terminal domain-containing protein [Bacillus sp. 3255]MDR6882836.1 hypothetical protein [Bacillus sp. 3255]